MTGLVNATTNASLTSGTPSANDTTKKWVFVPYTNVQRTATAQVHSFVPPSIAAQAAQETASQDIHSSFYATTSSASFFQSSTQPSAPMPPQQPAVEAQNDESHSSYETTANSLPPPASKVQEPSHKQSALHGVKTICVLSGKSWDVFCSALDENTKKEEAKKSNCVIQ